jgi:hypothetical protein
MWHDVYYKKSYLKTFMTYYIDFSDAGFEVLPPSTGKREENLKASSAALSYRDETPYSPPWVRARTI